MSQTLYIKQGRKYVPVREHAPEVHDSLPFGQYVVTVSAGSTRLKRVDAPASAEGSDAIAPSLRCSRQASKAFSRASGV